MAAFVALASLFPAAPADGQLIQLLKAVANGGSWINLPVEKGRASLSSPVVPLAGLSINGCLHVWSGIPGSGPCERMDTLGDKTLEVVAEPGKPVRFDYKAGLQAQLDLTSKERAPGHDSVHVGLGWQGEEGC